MTQPATQTTEGPDQGWRTAFALAAVVVFAAGGFALAGQLLRGKSSSSSSNTQTLVLPYSVPSTLSSPLPTASTAIRLAPIPNHPRNRKTVVVSTTIASGAVVTPTYMGTSVSSSSHMSETPAPTDNSVISAIFVAGVLMLLVAGFFRRITKITGPGGWGIEMTAAALKAATQKATQDAKDQDQPAPTPEQVAARFDELSSRLQNLELNPVRYHVPSGLGWVGRHVPGVRYARIPQAPVEPAQSAQALVDKAAEDLWGSS